jgi:pyrimidine operon attenuation protein / uracil phosphoribosyltransferase
MATLDNLDPILKGMTTQLLARQHAQHPHDIVMVGIHTGGVWVAERLHQLLGVFHPLGKLNISFYRDDFSQRSQPTVKPSDLPVEINNRHIILVDDVIYTGRTVRAALNELFDYGRPASVTLAVLVKRGGRELPIQPDVIGCAFDLDSNYQVKLSGPEPLSLEIGLRTNEH